MPQPPTHSERHDVYERILGGSKLEGRHVSLAGGQRVHVIEAGDGPPVVLLHGTGEMALFLRPLLERLDRVRVIAVDRPGHGLSDPMDVAAGDYRQVAVAWVDRLLDTLDLHDATLVGNSMGGLWALWYALSRPERVHRLVLLAGTPGLPGARVPLPFRVMALPGVGRLLQRLSPPTPKSVVQFARLVGEGETIVEHPDLIDVLIVAGRDPLAAATDLAEAHTLVSPYAIVAPTAYRRRYRVQPHELRQLAAPTLLVWGEREPVGSVPVAQTVAALIPDARLEVLDAGHGPWLGHAERIARLVTDFAQQEPSRSGPMRNQPQGP